MASAATATTTAAMIGSPVARTTRPSIHPVTGAGARGAAGRTAALRGSPLHAATAHDAIHHQAARIRDSVHGRGHDSQRHAVRGITLEIGLAAGSPAQRSQAVRDAEGIGARRCAAVGAAGRSARAGLNA